MRFKKKLPSCVKSIRRREKKKKIGGFERNAREVSEMNIDCDAVWLRGEDSWAFGTVERASYLRDNARLKE